MLALTTKLVSIHKLCKDNNVFIEVYDKFLFVKDNCSKRIILQGPVDNGLYKFLVGATKVTVHSRHHDAFVEISLVWHDKLVHAFEPIVSKILQSCGISVSYSTHLSSVCISCEIAKSIYFLTNQHM